DAGQRFASTADLHRALRDLRDHLSEAMTTETSIPAIVPPPTTPLAGSIWPWLVAASTFVLGCIVALVAVPREGPGLGTLRFTPFATEEGVESSPAWSPDGKTIAYIAEIDG